jgi:exosortase
VTQPSANRSIAVRSQASGAALLFLLAISVVSWYGSLSSTLKMALTSDAYTYILLIIPLSLALIFMRTREDGATDADRRWIGAILLGVALLLRAVTAWNVSHLSATNTLSLTMFAVVTWWIGSVIVSFGVQASRTFVFPLCFLLLAVPLPESALNWVTVSLQQQSAVGAELLFRAARVPVERDGVVLSIPGVDLEVARECSSLRSSALLIVITLFLANLFLRSWWRQALLVAIAIPLSVAKNALRIFIIAELGTRIDPSYFEGRLHRQGGIVFLGIAVLLMVGLLWAIRRNELRAVRTTSAES